ncbi:MAG: hypothetical protein J1E62_05780 [Lachnospiraceae bacterium]|nr:hypothetical protein [Lachnospiraceae bacterium]
MKQEAEMILDLRHINWDEKMWSRFLRRVKKKVHLAECGEIGVLPIQTLRKRTSYETQVIVKGYLSEYLDKYAPLKIELGDVGETQKKLPLVPETDSDTYLFYSTRLAILQTDSSAAEHLQQYFLDLRLFYNKNYSNFLFFEEDLEKMLRLQYKSYIDVEKDGKILDFLRGQLCRGYYVNVHLDEFYMSSKDYCDKRHFVHENLIYGFDDEKREFYAYGMTKRQQTAEFTISYEEFLPAYEKGKLFYFCGADYLDIEGYYPIIVYSIPALDKYEFTENVFVHKIAAFLNPDDDEPVENDIHVYGKNVYDWILQDLTGEKIRNIVDYRVIHLLYEHKKCICSRMEYLLERDMLSEANQKLLEEMKEVVSAFQKVRLLYLKELRKEEKLYSMNKVVEDSAVKKNIARELEESIKREETVLTQICSK